MLVRNLLFLLQLLVLWVFPSFPFRFITNSKIYQRVATTTSSSIYQPMNAQLMLYQSVKVDSQNKISSRQRIYIYNLIEILSRYKELYGNYSIPAKFTIPSTQDWPEHSWGLQLGMKVVDIRRGRSFQSCSSIELLHRIGFPLISQRLLKKIFKTDESLNVSLNIIPGINKTRKRHRYNYEQDILTPCRIYKAVYGNLFIPIDWIVPEDNIWPQLYWGYNLGHKLQLFRKDSRYMCYINTKDQDFINSFETNVICEQLNELGFVWNIKDYKFFKLLQVILRYKDIYGHVNVPVRYIVPESLEFPISFHGYRLGFIWHRFRRGYMFYNDKYLQQLSQLDLLQYMSDKLLSYNSYESNCEWNKFAIDTSITKIEQNHHLNISFLNEVINTFISIEKSDINSISSSYKISVSNQSDNNWPCSSSGLKLGKIIKKFHRLGSENVTKDIRDMLVKHGFIFKANFNDVNVLIHAIEIFKVCYYFDPFTCINRSCSLLRDMLIYQWHFVFQLIHLGLHQ